MSSTALPSGLIPSLLRRFSSSEGYQLYPDVLPFFNMLRIGETDPRFGAWPWKRTIVGVISNSDDRIIGVLKSFGLTVASLRDHMERDAENRTVVCQLRPDISFVVLSYDVDAEKPSQIIFKAAERLAKLASDNERITSPSVLPWTEDIDKIYVGDDLAKDIVGARKAGWEAVLIQRGSGDDDKMPVPSKEPNGIQWLDWSHFGMSPPADLRSEKVPTVQNLQGLLHMRDLFLRRQYWTAARYNSGGSPGS